MLRHMSLVCFLTIFTLVTGCGGKDHKKNRRQAEISPTEEQTGSEKPRLTSVTPSAANVGATVKLSGTDLGTSGKVFFGTTAASQTSGWSQASISVVVPVNAGNTVYVVTNGLTSNKISFTVLSSNTPPPVVPTGTLSGTIFSSTAVTVAGAQVAIASNGSFTANLRTALTNASGVYSIVLPAGDYYVKASKDVNGNTIFFEVGSDEIGWGNQISVVANQTVTRNVNLFAPANSSITGTLTQSDTSWGASVSGVTSFDVNLGVVRYYAPSTTSAQYTLPEVLGASVGVISFRDTNNNSLFDAGLEPAITLNANVAVPSTGINGNFPSRRVLSGTVSNGNGWTIMAIDRNNNDPASSAWVVGTQVLGNTGAFTIVGLPTQYRILAFQDTNGNGVPDNGETELRLSRPDVDASADNVTGLSFVIPSASQGTLAGTIFDSFSNPAPFARIIVADNATFDANPRQVIADSLGNYAIAVPAGDYYIKASLDKNTNGVYFEAGIDEIGWNGVFTADLGLTTTADIFLEPAAQAAIAGTLTDTGTSWGSVVTGVASYDLGTGFVRYQTLTSLGVYSLKEVTGVTVGLITFRDLDGDGKFDADVEPALTVSGGVASPATVNYDWTTRVKRTLSGTITNGAGWTLYAEDRTFNDPAGNRWIVGRQVLGVSGAFQITGIPTTYRLRAFLDTNGNGVPDNGEPDIRLRDTDGVRRDVNVTAGDANGIIKLLRPLIRIENVRVSSDTSGDGYLQPGESGTLEVTLRNSEGPATSVTAVSTAMANVTVNGQSGPPATLAYNATATMSIAVTAAANAAIGEQIEIDITIDAQPGTYNTTRTAYIGLFAGAPYTVTSIPATYASIATNGNAVRLNGAENDQGSDFVDLQGGGNTFTGQDFAFPLYGMWMTDGAMNPFGNGLPIGIEVGDNGYVNFLNAADLTPLPLPSFAVDTQFVMAPIWSDLMPNEVWALVTGTAPARTLTIEWKGAARFPTPSLSLNFQLKLYETTGTMDVIYDTITLVAGDEYGLNYGDGSTITRWPTPAPGMAYRLTRTW